MRSGNKPGFKKMGATEAIKQVDTEKAAKGKGSEREIYKAKLRGDYMDLTGDKLKKASYDDPSGTVVSRDPHYLDSPNKQKVDPDAPGTPGKPGYEPPVKRSDLDAKGKAIWDAHRAKRKSHTKKPKQRSPKNGLDDKSKAVKNFFEKNKGSKTVTEKEFKETLKRQDGKRFTSPAKQKDFNKTGSKASTTPGYSTTKAANKGLPKNFNATGSSKAGKFAKVSKKPTSTLGRVTKTFQNTPRQFARQGKEILKTTNRNLISGGKQILKKGTKNIVKAIGLLPTLMLTPMSASANDQPTKGKGKREYPGGKIDFTKKK